MDGEIRTLRLWQMIYLGKGASFVRQVIHAVISVAIRLFFRRIEVTGVERVPAEGPLIFVLNHPNGLVDPALVFVSMPRRVSFLAKSTLFDNPIGRFVLETLEILPVYRRIDAGADVASNAVTFENCFELLERGRCIAIFPEGVSHDEPKLQKIKTGAARIALGSPVPVKIVPVGLFYTSKTSFRSEALIRYGAPFEAGRVEADKGGEPPREAVLALTAEIERHLREVTVNLETETELDAVVRAEALFSSVFENLIFRQTLTQTVIRLQGLAAKYALLEKEDPQRMRELNERVTDYETRLRESGLTTDSLSVLQHPTWYVFRYLLLRLAVLVILAPAALVGGVIHSPAYLFSSLLGRIFRMHDTDVAGASSSIVAAIGLMPLTWAVLAGLIWYFVGWQAALVSVPIAILCGYIALRSAETLVDMQIWLKAAWLLIRRRGLLLRLMIQRETLQREIGEIVEE